MEPTEQRGGDGVAMTRRRFVKHGVVTTGLMIAGPPLFLSACSDDEAVTSSTTVAGDTAGPPGYGALRPAGPELELPEGFRYAILSREGDRMSDGLRTPAYPDGTAAFEGSDGTIVLVRNHEQFDPGKAIGPERAYDPSGQGGVTTLVFDPASEKVVESRLTLNGTDNNCNGGRTPQRSWLSCEESTVGRKAGFEREHGYVFEVPASAREPVEPRPLKAMGRFVHEAAVVDPATGVVYMTEDEGPKDGFYRFVPNAPGKYETGGRLELLKVRGESNFDTRKGQRVGDAIETEWVGIDDVDPHDAEDEPHAVLYQGLDKGGAVFVALEGAWWDEADGSAVMAASEGGDAGLGQIWRYRPTGDDTGELTLVAESTGEGEMEEPDNVTVSPRGGIIACEDGTEGTDNFLRGVTPDGEIFPFARNTIEVDGHQLDAEDFDRGELRGFSEFAGASYSPDGKWLFVSVQVPGVTYAITGPWEQGLL
jgi:uncharacterized protein